jgi:hypothetical protein
MSASDRQVGGDHYKTMGVQTWDVVDTWPVEQQIGYYRGGALKYLMRMGSKDESPQEIAKGQHYMQKLLEVLNADTRKESGLQEGIGQGVTSKAAGSAGPNECAVRIREISRGLADVGPGGPHPRNQSRWYELAKQPEGDIQEAQ